MITLIVLIALMLVCFILAFCFRLAGGVLKVTLKLILVLPCVIVVGALGVLFCCTLILIPLGIACFKLIGCLLNPFMAAA